MFSSLLTIGLTRCYLLYVANRCPGSISSADIQVTKLHLLLPRVEIKYSSHNTQGCWHHQLMPPWQFISAACLPLPSPHLEVLDKLLHGDLVHKDEVPQPHRCVQRHGGSLQDSCLTLDTWHLTLDTADPLLQCWQLAPPARGALWLGSPPVTRRWQHAPTALRSTLCIVNCTMYTVHCSLHTVHCKLHSVHCTLHSVHHTLYNLYSTL